MIYNTQSAQISQKQDERNIYNFLCVKTYYGFMVIMVYLVKMQYHIDQLPNSKKYVLLEKNYDVNFQISNKGVKDTEAKIPSRKGKKVKMIMSH